jgi:hypothetical protein
VTSSVWIVLPAVSSRTFLFLIFHFPQVTKPIAEHSSLFPSSCPYCGALTHLLAGTAPIIVASATFRDQRLRSRRSLRPSSIRYSRPPPSQFPNSSPFSDLWWRFPCDNWNPLLSTLTGFSPALVSSSVYHSPAIATLGPGRRSHPRPCARKPCSRFTSCSVFHFSLLDGFDRPRESAHQKPAILRLTKYVSQTLDNQRERDFGLEILMKENTCKSSSIFWQSNLRQRSQPCDPRDSLHIGVRHNHATGDEGSDGPPRQPGEVRVRWLPGLN